jgi:ribosome-associated protein
MFRIAHGLALEDWELSETFIRASGPGGQNVNKVASAVQLRFDAAGSPSLPEDVKARLKKIAGRRMTKDGVVIIEARRFRDQERNRADARARLAALIEKAATPPAPRKATRIPKSQKQKRLENKHRRSEIKAKRARPGVSD